MVSFSCEACGDVLTKGKLDKHVSRCRGASFTCIDCMTHFQGSSYRSHTSCMTEAQKYEGQFYKEKERKHKPGKQGSSSAMIPHKAYVEDVPDDTEMGDAQAVAVIDVPPRAPTPPAHDPLPPNINVFDYLVKDNGRGRTSGTAALHGNSQASPASDDSHFAQHGYSYGNQPLQQTMNHQASVTSLVPQNGSQVGEHQYLTTAPHKRHEARHEDRTSERKRKRKDEEPRTAKREERPSLQSGLTGGLTRLLSASDHSQSRLEEQERSPLSPKKRTRTDERRSGDERRRAKESSEQGHKAGKTRGSALDSQNGEGPSVIEHSMESKRPGNQLVQYRNPGELFLSFINKGPESDSGMSINKVLKRYHREREADSGRDKESNDKELWKELRLRRNDRGEIVLFV